MRSILKSAHTAGRTITRQKNLVFTKKAYPKSEETSVNEEEDFTGHIEDTSSCEKLSIGLNMTEALQESTYAS
jgi:hypothetical protein